HQAVVVPRFGADGVFLVGDAEQDDRRDAELVRLVRVGDRFVDRDLRLAGQGGDGLALAAAGDDEDGQDEGAGVEVGLAHELAQGLGATHATRAIFGELHVDRGYSSFGRSASEETSAATSGAGGTTSTVTPAATSAARVVSPMAPTRVPAS